MRLQIDNTISSIINAIPNPVILSDGSKIQSSNSAFLDFFGVVSIDEFNEAYQCLDQLFIKDNGFFTHDSIDSNEGWIDYLYTHADERRLVLLQNKNGELKNFEITIKKIENQPEYIIVFTDITPLISEKNEYKYYAMHDHLTKIYNRQKFDESLVREIENKKRYKEPFSLILIDIDRFKNVNDTYGHMIGDLVLISLSSLIGKNLRATDIFARWGGEEFIILLPHTTANQAFLKATEIRELIEQYTNEKLPNITISLGVTEYSDSDTSDTALQRLDEALYVAKQKRNDVIVL